MASGQTFGLGLKDLAPASKLWPQPQTFGVGLVVLLCNGAFFPEKLCKIREFC